MAKKRLKRSRRLYSKMDKRKRRTERKKRKGGKSKRVKKTQKGGCSMCGSRPNNRHKVWVVNGANPPGRFGVQIKQQFTEGIGLTDYRMATKKEIDSFKEMGHYVFPSEALFNKYMNLTEYDESLERYKNK